MGLKHEAKKGDTIEANGVTIKVLRGSPRLEITAPLGIPITTCRINVAANEASQSPKPTTNRAVQ